ncbi:MAG: hypothetical protein JRJ62_08525 [Deltaproteobacteria bacterium]|nr:hypothetical protein [Deltaproteobacteria bacterium]
MNIDRTGTFLVSEIDRALGQTKKQQLPQLTIKVKVNYWYDQTNEEWIDVSEYGMETNAYFVLIFDGKNGPETSLSFNQIMKVYNWDGRDFQVLTEIPAPESFMIKVEDNDPEYTDKNPFVVNWIDEADADPRGGLKKLDAKGIQALQSQFGALLNKAGKAIPPASAKKAPPEIPQEVLPPKQTAAEKKAAKEAKSARVKKANEDLQARMAEVSPVKPAEVADESSKTKTKQEAYMFVYEMQAEGTTDDARNAAWNAAIKQVAGDIDQKEITGEQWYQIMHETLNDVGAA